MGGGGARQQLVYDHGMCIYIIYIFIYCLIYV